MTTSFRGLIAISITLFLSSPLYAQVASAGVGVVAGAVGRVLGKGSLSGSELNHDRLVAAAEESNRGLPKMIDQNTRLDSVAAELGKTMVFNNTLLSISGFDLAKFYGVMAPQLRAKACAAPETRRLIDSGIKMVWTYKSSSGQHLGSIHVASPDCRPQLAENGRPISISELRVRFPELAGLDDQRLVDAMHSAYYPDLPRHQIARALGVNDERPVTPKRANKLGPIDRWRYDSCLDQAAKAPTSRGVALGQTLCEQRFEQ